MTLAEQMFLRFLEAQVKGLGAILKFRLEYLNGSVAHGRSLDWRTEYVHYEDESVLAFSVPHGRDSWKFHPEEIVAEVCRDDWEEWEHA